MTRALAGLVGLTTIAVLSYCLGAARNARALRRAEWRTSRLLAAVDRLEQERDVLSAENADMRDFLAVIKPSEVA